MSFTNLPVYVPPFPHVRPPIIITPSEEPPFTVDWRELAWWFAVPEVGDHTCWAIYDPPEWHCTSSYDMQAQRPALVHGIEGVEFAANVFEPR